MATENNLVKLDTVAVGGVLSALNFIDAYTKKIICERQLSVI